MLLENGIDITQGTPSTDANETRTYDLGIADRQNNGNIYQCLNGAIMSENTTLNVQCKFVNVCTVKRETAVECDLSQGKI